MVVREIEKIEAPQKLHPTETDQVNGKERSGDAKHKRADEPVMKSFSMLPLREAQHHHGDDEGVVGAQKTFESDEERNGQQI
jgi:hypothetical protein